MLKLLHQNRLCAVRKPAVTVRVWGLGARVQASILVFDTMQYCIDPFWDKSSFVASIEDAKTCPDTKPVLYQGRFCSSSSECQDVLTDPIRYRVAVAGAPGMERKFDRGPPYPTVVSRIKHELGAARLLQWPTIAINVCGIHMNQYQATPFLDPTM